MIEIAGAKWTTKEETLALVEHFHDQEYFKHADPETAAYAGSKITEPKCDKEEGGCGGVTCYMVIDGSDGGKMNHWWLGLTKSAALRKDGLLYIPIQLCVRCSAARDGWRAGRHQPAARKWGLERISRAPLTEEEKEAYRTVYQRAFEKGQAKTKELLEGSTKKKGRYEMQSQKAAPAQDQLWHTR